MATQLKVYPGMIDRNYEFFSSPDALRVINNGSIMNFNEIPMPLYQRIKELIDKSPEAKEILNEWFPDSEIKRLEKFAECRFGGLDFEPDITPETTQFGEYWDCPLRGVCKGEGKVCLPLTYNNHPLDATEIKVLRLMATDLTNDVISSQLDIALGSLHKIKKILYQKLNILTKQEAALIARELNLI